MYQFSKKLCYMILGLLMGVSTITSSALAANIMSCSENSDVFIYENNFKSSDNQNFNLNKDSKTISDTIDIAHKATYTEIDMNNALTIKAGKTLTGIIPANQSLIIKFIPVKIGFYTMENFSSDSGNIYPGPWYLYENNSSYYRLVHYGYNPALLRKNDTYYFELHNETDEDHSFSYKLSNDVSIPMVLNKNYISQLSELHRSEGYCFTPNETAVYSISLIQQGTSACVELFDENVAGAYYIDPSSPQNNSNDSSTTANELYQQFLKGKHYYIRVYSNHGFDTLDETYSYTLKIQKQTASIALNKTNLTLPVSNETTLKATISPNTANTQITWTTSNKSIATVNSKGTVTAKAPGTATIIAKCNGATAKCKVTVALAVPKLKTAKSAAAGKIKITWAKSAGADGYIVYRKKGADWIKLKTVDKSTTTFTDTKLTSGKKYTYTVKAYKKVNGKTYTSDFDTAGIAAKAK